MRKDGEIEAKVRRSVCLTGQCRRFLKGQVCSDLYIYRSLLFLRAIRLSKHLSRVYRLAYFWHVFTFDENTDSDCIFSECLWIRSAEDRDVTTRADQPGRLWPRHRSSPVI